MGFTENTADMAAYLAVEGSLSNFINQYAIERVPEFSIQQKIVALHVCAATEPGQSVLQYVHYAFV